jgi:molybdenum cofactor biosynthesis enzyme
VPSSYTTLLGLVQPVTGELTNTWGNTVNSQLTQLVEDAIAQYSTASVTSGDWTLTTTAGGAQNQARTAILIATGAPGTTRYIYAPQLSKTYVVINNCSDQSSVWIRGGTSSSYTTGVEIEALGSALVAWDSTASDFVKIAGGGGGAAGTGNNQVFFQNDLTVTGSYTIPTGKNAGTFGPITVNSGVTVTVPSGSVWTVV